MIGNLIRSFEGKKILILGFGLEGQSTYQFVRRHYPEIPLTIADKDYNLHKRIPGYMSDRNLTLATGTGYLRGIAGFDMIFKSPGIPFRDIEQPVVFTSQADLIIRHFRSQVIGVTGTKGKSTTASLLYHILQLAGIKSVLVGNIGIPPLDLVSEWDDRILIIYELSSHQLEHLQTSPHISILLNLYQEHLDRYLSFKDYGEAKLNIVRFQRKGDQFIYNLDDKIISGHLDSMDIHSNRICYSPKSDKPTDCTLKGNNLIQFHPGGYSVVFPTNDFQLKGEHNLMNIMAAVNCCMVLGVGPGIILRGINTFKGLEHRLEYVGYYEGIHFYNDSIATVPEATMHAIKALEHVDTLILGGFDRGIDYSELVGFIAGSTVRNVIFVGQAGQRIKQMMLQDNLHNKQLLDAADYKEVVSLAKKYTRKNTICLLSPAAASYDMFSDFKERGNVYKDLTRRMDPEQ
jgi:UDP-N-acetylmuramoylalanine--D-glutamate ligase